MIAPKRRLTNYALHGREEWFKRIFRDQIAEAAGILEVVLSGIVLAALLMSMEAVFSAVGGVINLHEMLSVREWVGCGIMLLTIFYVQLPHREPVKREPVKAA